MLGINKALVDYRLVNYKRKYHQQHQPSIFFFSRLVSISDWNCHLTLSPLDTSDPQRKLFRHFFSFFLFLARNHFLWLVSIDPFFAGKEKKLEPGGQIWNFIWEVVGSIPALFFVKTYSFRKTNESRKHPQYCYKRHF